MIRGLVSVVLPTYKGADRIATVLKSLQSQTYSDFETIIVDDCSPEEHWEVVARASQDYPRTNAIRMEVNQGPGAARNAGIRAASGEFIAFLDDDDRWNPVKLEMQVAATRVSDNVGLVGCGIRQIFRGLDFTYQSLPSQDELGFADLIMENYLGGTSSVLVRAEALSECGGFDLGFPAREEYDLWLRVSKCWRVVLVPEVLMDYFHDLSRESRISNSFQRYVDACERLNSKWLDEIRGLPERAKRQRLSEQRFFLGSQAVKAGLSMEGCRWYCRSFLEKPSAKALAGMALAPFGFRNLLRLRGLISGTR
jgi:glycosyltransferase involved in cell wall biosynthesis